MGFFTFIRALIKRVKYALFIKGMLLWLKNKMINDSRGIYMISEWLYVKVCFVVWINDSPTEID